MPNFEMASPGHSFVDGIINLSWGVGREESDVQKIDKKDYTARFIARVNSGLIVESKRKATVEEPEDTREYALLTGEEARKHKEIPAGPVTRTVYSPELGRTVQVEIGMPRILDEQLQRAEALLEKQRSERQTLEANPLLRVEDEPTATPPDETGSTTTDTTPTPPAGDSGTEEEPGAVAGSPSEAPTAEETAGTTPTDQPAEDERTVDQLKDELRARDLPVSGNRDELLERLSESDAQHARTVEDLQEELRSKGLPVSGSKSELIARLNEAG